MEITSSAVAAAATKAARRFRVLNIKLQLVVAGIRNSFNHLPKNG
jgi:hypothetical protein